MSVNIAGDMEMNEQAYWDELNELEEELAEGKITLAEYNSRLKQIESECDLS